MRKDIIGLFFDDTDRLNSKGKLERFRERPKIPNTGWTTPKDFPNLFNEKIIGLDVETFDPELKTHGPGWARGVGHLVGISLSTKIQSWYFPIRHETEPEHNLEPASVFAYLKDLLAKPMAKVGANIIYDLGWLKQENIKVNGLTYDIQYSEALLDDVALSYSLESIAQKYLKEGKVSNVLYEWLAEWFGGSPDGRQRANIYKSPPRLCGPYAEADASLPLKILDIQYPKLKEAGLWDLFTMECELIPVLMGMRFRGLPVNINKAAEVEKQLEKEIYTQKGLLDDIAGFDLNVNATSDLVKLYDKLGIKYPYTEKGNPSFNKQFLTTDENKISKTIVEIRKLEKMNTTFIKGAILDKNIKGKIYPNFHPLRGEAGGAVSGRYSSSNPNAQNIPSRDKILAPLVRGIFCPEQGFDKWIKLDLCLTGDTPILSTKGPIPIKDLIPGKDKVLSINLGNPYRKTTQRQRVVLDKKYKLVEKVAEIGIEPVYLIEFEDGSSVKSTSEHKWLRYLNKREYGEHWVKTKELEIGTRLSHVITSPDKEHGYIYHTFKGAVKRANCVLESTVGLCPYTGGHSDHINGDRFDDRPENLRWLTAKENLSQGGKRYWEQVKAGRDDTNRLNALRDGIKNRRSYAGEGNPNYGKKRPGVGGRPFTGTIKQCLYCNEDIKCKPSKPAKKWCDKVCRKAYTNKQHAKNHRVVKITKLPPEKVYQITVADWHNYVLDNGLISKNSQIEYRMFAHYSNDKELISEYQNPDTDYHDIVSGFLLHALTRKLVKNFNFMSLYGGGRDKTIDMIKEDMTQDDLLKAAVKFNLNDSKKNTLELVADHFINLYTEKFPAAKRVLNEMSDEAMKTGEIRTILNRRNTFNMWEKKGFGKYPALPFEAAMSKYGTNIKRAKTYIALNRKLQGSAADLLKKGMLDAYKAGLFKSDKLGFPHVTVHDELDFSFHDDLRKEALELVSTVEQAIKLKVPVIMDIETGTNWGNVDEIDWR